MGEKQKGEYLTGKLLIAMPGLSDTRFHRAVIFMMAHDDEGAMGLVINHSLQGVEFADLVKQLKIESDIKIDIEGLDLTVLCGGPVETGRGFLLHSHDFQSSDTMEIDQNFGVTGTVQALKKVLTGNGPEQMLFILGYAGWDAGQLEDELQQGAWLVVDANSDLVFKHGEEDKWSRAVKSIGIDPMRLSTVGGHA